MTKDLWCSPQTWEIKDWCKPKVTIVKNSLITYQRLISTSNGGTEEELQEIRRKTKFSLACTDILGQTLSLSILLVFKMQQKVNWVTNDGLRWSKCDLDLLLSKVFGMEPFYKVHHSLSYTRCPCKKIIVTKMCTGFSKTKPSKNTILSASYKLIIYKFQFFHLRLSAVLT